MIPPPEGKVITVCGEIEPSELGVTLVHEHVFVDLRSWFTPPAERVAWRGGIEDLPVTMDLLGVLRRDPYVNVDNTFLDDPDVASDELGRFASAGGRAIVEMSCVGLGGDRAGLVDVARRSGVHIIAAAGMYKEESLTEEQRARSEEQLHDDLLADIDGDATGVPAGAIGEMGTSNPATDVELRNLGVAAAVAAETGLSLHVHLEPGARDGLEVAEIATAALPPERVVLGHIDLDPAPDHGYIRALADTGCHLALDTFGLEHVVDSLDATEPRDSERIALFMWLVEQGSADQIVVSHDLATKTGLRHYGGYGYDHFLRDIAPQLRHQGIADEVIRHALVDAPRSILTVTRSAGSAA